MKSPNRNPPSVHRRLACGRLGLCAYLTALGCAVVALITVPSSVTPSCSHGWVWVLAAVPPVALPAFYKLLSKHHARVGAADSGQGGAGPQAISRPALAAPSRASGGEASSAEPVTIPFPIPIDLEALPLEARAQKHILLAEALALREIEAEVQHPIRRQVPLRYEDAVDGLFFRDGRPVIVEVQPLRRRSIEAGLRHIQQVQDVLDPRADAILVAIGDGLTRQDKTRSLHDILVRASDLRVALEARVLDLDDLRRKYGVQ